MSREHRFLDFVSSVVPWLAPAPTAWIAYVHLSQVLALPLPIAAAGALVVEGLGLSTIHTALSFWKDDGLRSVRLWLAVGAGAFYLAVVIVVNIILDSGAWQTVTAKSLLSLTSIPAALIVALRAQDARRRASAQEAAAHAEIERQAALSVEQQARAEAAAERKHERELRHAERLAKIQVGQVNFNEISQSVNGISVKSYMEFQARMSEMNGNGPKTATQAAEMFGLSGATAWRYWKKFHAPEHE
jgi:hypothetical protein